MDSTSCLGKLLKHCTDFYQKCFEFFRWPLFLFATVNIEKTSALSFLLVVLVAFHCSHSIACMSILDWWDQDHTFAGASSVPSSSSSEFWLLFNSVSTVNPAHSSSSGQPVPSLYCGIEIVSLRHEDMHFPSRTARSFC